MVGGFLGAGKTTLVRRILADAQRRGIRVALVSNEFGELGVDRALLGAERGDYVELSGGCVCCRLSDRLVETLGMLRERVRPERLVIETSGVALPYDIQLNFWREPIAGWIRDDAVVVLVNAEQLHEGRDLAGTFEQQVSSADLLVLNQIDRVPESALPELERRLRAIEPQAPILRARHADIDLAPLFPPELARPSGARHAPDLPPPHSHEEFRAEEIECESGVAEARLRAKLEALGALRIKGFVRTAQGLRVVQGVGARIELEPVAELPNGVQLGRVVAIRRA